MSSEIFEMKSSTRQDSNELLIPLQTPLVYWIAETFEELR